MTVDERNFTPWASPGWESWDPYSPELGFCEFLAVMQRMLQPKVVLETGASGGRVTGFLDLTNCTYLGFEHDPRFRTPPSDPIRPTPDPDQVAVADMLILDSDPSHRLDEIARWAEHGRPGSTCIVHDAGNGHGPGYCHNDIRAAIVATGIRGVFLANPRGGWMGQHP